MEINDIKPLVDAQRAFFATNSTFSIEFRKNALEKLSRLLKDNQKELLKAINLDLGKSDFESMASELQVTHTEIKYMLKNLDKLARKRSSRPPFALFSSKTYVQAEPYGLSLIISPWNYPVQLVFLPLVGAIAAGNCVIIKSSELAPHSSNLMAKLIAENFPKEYIALVEGGADIATELLKQKYDFIFYTGSTRIGKIVMEAAAKHLTPVCLELGGKSPCVVLKDANIDLTAKRIAFGKVFNAGQTCIAPDYVLVEEEVYDALSAKLNYYFEKFAPDALNNSDYPFIINEQNFDRLLALAGEHDVEHDREKRKIKLSLIHNPDVNSEIMQEEIFGPLLPIIPIKNYEEAMLFIRSKDKPLAAYLFTENKDIQEDMSIHCACGGLCINDTIIHFAAHNLPFGGVGASGMGSYHGKHSFDCFSHLKPVVNQSTSLDFKFRYPPYSARIKKILL